MRDKIDQEFYCTKSGGGCGGYFTVPLNNELSGNVEVVCPKCKHRHRRVVKNGEIVEEGRFDKDAIDSIEPVISAWSEKPKSKVFSQGVDYRQERNSVVLRGKQDFLKQSWQDRFGVCKK